MVSVTTLEEEGGEEEVSDRVKRDSEGCITRGGW